MTSVVRVPIKTEKNKFSSNVTSKLHLTNGLDTQNTILNKASILIYFNVKFNQGST